MFVADLVFFTEHSIIIETRLGKVHLNTRVALYNIGIIFTEQLEYTNFSILTLSL